MNHWTQLPKQLHSVVAATPGSVLLQTSRFDESNQRSLLFVDVVRTISACELDEIPELFRQIEEALADGMHVAGYVGYECGHHFERFSGVTVRADEVPLAWFGIYRAPLIYDHARGCFEEAVDLPEMPCGFDDMPVRFAEHVDLEISEEDYCAKIQRIKEYIAAGETYQVNFTDRVRVATKVSAAVAFGALLQQQPVAYSAFLNLPGHAILSLSPELFFKVEDGRIITQPMKGTMPRGMNTTEDVESARRLQNDEKNRSEHVMIVDLLRNDLGRICEMGSVRVENLFSVEKYETLLQMTSTVSGTLRSGLSYYEIFKGLFPSGSITGAPKIRTMQIIHELERGPRGVYTGAIGYIAPNGNAAFNVAIRTVVMKDGEARMGVGGGIVADSQPLDEYRECLLKTEFLVRPPRDFQLIETMLWDSEVAFLDMHLDRLESSAEYFNFKCDRSAVVGRLEEEAKGFERMEKYRVRLLMDAAGVITVAALRYRPDPWTGRVRLSAERNSSTDVFIRHKTTRRGLYDRQLAEARAAGFDEVIFLNERGEITEGAISNIFVRKDGRLLTSPTRCGVLPGIYRRHLLETSPDAEERVLTLDDLRCADEVFLCNSVRGIQVVGSIDFGDLST